MKLHPSNCRHYKAIRRRDGWHCIYCDALVKMSSEREAWEATS